MKIRASCIFALALLSNVCAATALAIHYAGSKEAFVDLMNRRAREIGMRNTVFHSVHGLPPGKGQLPAWISPGLSICKTSLTYRLKIV